MRKFALMLGTLFAALSLAGFASVAASAANPITATASVTGHPDTTIGGLPGTACGTSPGGPVWALDYYTMTVTATKEATPANTWAVHVQDSGNYYGFADPTTCNASLSTGTFTGSYDLTVTSATAPTAAGLKSSYTTDSTSGVMIPDFFGLPHGSSAVVGGAYDFSYQGGNYVQDTSGERGDVTPVACTVTITNPGTQNNVLGDKVSLQLKATSNYPGNIEFFVGNLPHGLSGNPPGLTGLITGTVDRTGTNVVDVKAANVTPPFGERGEQGFTCTDEIHFNWNVTATASTPTPTPTGTSTPPVTGVPTGGVQTGGGLPHSVFTAGDLAGTVLLLCAGLVLCVGYTLRRLHQDS